MDRNKGYVVGGTNYARYDVDDQGVDPGYPRAVAGSGYEDGWQLGGSGFEAGFDAALDDGIGRVWFFAGDRVLEIDQTTHFAVGGMPLVMAFPGLVAAGFDHVDAATNWGDDRAFFVTGDQVMEWCLVRNTPLAPPVTIAEAFPALADSPFADGLDALCAWPNGLVYAFRDGAYRCFDRQTLEQVGADTSTIDGWGVTDDIAGDLRAVWFEHELRDPVASTAVWTPSREADQLLVTRLLHRIPTAEGGVATADGWPSWPEPVEGELSAELAQGVSDFLAHQGIAEDGIQPAANGGTAIGTMIALAQPNFVDGLLSAVAAGLPESVGEALGAPEFDGMFGVLRFNGSTLAGLATAPAYIWEKADTHWWENGGPASYLGYPKADTQDRDDPYGGLLVTSFERQTTIEDTGGGFRVVDNEIWDQRDAASFSMGEPTADPLDAGNGTTYTTFTNGAVSRSPDGMTSAMNDEVLQFWLDAVNAGSDVGTPYGSTWIADDGSTNHRFTGGEYSSTGGFGSVTTSPFLPPDRARHLRSSTSENRIDALYTGAETFNAMVAELRQPFGSDDYIYLCAWYCDVDLEMIPGDSTTTLRSMLQTATGAQGSGTGSAQVAAMLWQQTLPPRSAGQDPDFVLGTTGFDAVPPKVSSMLARTNSIAVRAINGLPNSAAILDAKTALFGSHHQKLLVIKRGDRLVAFVGGVDVNADRLYPQGSHNVVGVGSPLFDMHLRVEGPAAFDLLGTFTERWRATLPNGMALRGESAAPVATPPLGGCEAQVVHTYRRSYPFPVTIDSAAEAIAGIVRNATQCVYMECQYLVGNPLLDGAIRQAMSKQSELHLITVMTAEDISDLLDLPFHRRQFLGNLAAAFPGRVHTYERLANGVSARSDNSYVHAKVVLVDDRIAVVGSVNQCRRSYGHDSEVSLVFTEDNPLGPSAFGLPKQMRIKRWAHHLDRPEAGLDDLAASIPLWSGNSPTGSRIRASILTQPGPRPYPALASDRLWDVLVDPA